MNIKDYKELYLSGEKRPIEVIDEIFKNIESDNKSEKPLNAFISLRKEKALEEASVINDFSKPLAGIPIAVKDNINVEGELTTCGSRILSNYRAIFDAFVIKKLKDAGAIIIGKTNMDEFAMGSSNETSYFGPVRNPHDRDRVPGGSSGGSAASVISFVPISLGSDTGGSIRQPASFCGVVGVKPTYGRVSRFGLVAFASSLDQIGPFARSVEDAAIVYNVIGGHDPMDSTSLNKDHEVNIDNIKKDIKGLRVGIPKEYFTGGINEEVEKGIKKSIEVLKELEAKIVDISLPHTEYAVATYYIIAPAEASSNLARFDGIRYGVREKADTLIETYKKTRGNGFGKEVKRRIMIGTYVLSSGYYDAYYLSAQKVRTLIRDDFKKAFDNVDVIISPTSPTTAFKIGEKIDDPISMYLSDIFTISANIAGIPAMSIPIGRDSKKLPIGIQIMSKWLDEETMFRVAYNLEKNFDYK
ncbi:MAG TPA: Asp-tRNA(Asn)/Glu-tRNA(Gln) amidotransferase subunit GatA [Spirochaetota bacterium]|nr:Asp-tRNA(Asn)/Glu-tRNA(Gln) amidotransferase subunit GatA [Spirochaetota bacterium]